MPDEHSGLGFRTSPVNALFLGEGNELVFGDPIHLECDARAPAEAVAQRVSALARGDIFRDAG